jgi:threonine dehydratase
MEDKIELITYQDILNAHKIIADHVHHTPLIPSINFKETLDANLFFKAELFQKIGSFKLRGVLNKLHNLTEEEKNVGVITVSSGNHAQSLAYTASKLDIHAVVIMPFFSAKNKVKKAKKFGAEVIQLEENADLMAVLNEIKKERGLTLVHPFDDPFIIAGQGTVGLEILQDSVIVPDYVFVPVGGGGLISGIATSIKLKHPQVKIIGVEPIGAAVMHKSLRKNEVATLDRVNSIADGLSAPFAGKYTFAHMKRFVDDIVLVSDDEIIEALRLLFVEANILAEPAGAAGFAAILQKKNEIEAGANVVCVLSGGNIDLHLLKKIIN